MADLSCEISINFCWKAGNEFFMVVTENIQLISFQFIFTLRLHSNHDDNFASVPRAERVCQFYLAVCENFAWNFG